jgi:hypothetical protein
MRPICLALLFLGTACGVRAETLPAKVTLKKETALELVMDGKVVGASKAAAGTVVQLVERTPQGLKIALGPAVATVAEEDTDLQELMAARPTAPSPAPPPASPPAPVPVSPVETPPLAQSPSKQEPATLDVTAQNRPGSYETAQFRLWHPDPGIKTRGVLVLVPGSDADGRGMAGAGHWQNLARRFDLAILACYLAKGAYQDPSKGSGAALDDALEEFGKKIGQKDLSKLPLVMWGHSAGGQFNYNYAQWRPERIVAFTVNKGAYYVETRDRKAREVPGLFFVGLKDTELRIKNIGGIYGEGRGKEAPWCLIREPNEGHGVGKSEQFAAKYFEAILPLRLPPGQEKIQDIDLSKGWLGHLETREIAPAAGAGWKAEDSAWFPSEELAKLWKEIVSG